MLLCKHHLESSSLIQSINQDCLDYPERVLQIGEGNFLRGFADWVIHRLNSHGLFRGRIVIAAPRPTGGKNIKRLNSQDGLYTVWLRGMARGEVIDTKEVITCISRGIDPSTEWMEFLRCAEDRNIDIIISNTTEAGLDYHPEQYLEGGPLITYPARLTAYLFHRYKTFSGDRNAGVTIIPCELVEGNGKLLFTRIITHAEAWNLPMDFVDWVSQANTFCNTLVDRIVTGYPETMQEEDIASSLGYEDNLLTVAEPFHLWAIEGDDRLRCRLLTEGLELNVHIVDDVTSFRQKKVRILNGAHTTMTYVALLSGVESVGDVMRHPLFGEFIREVLYREVIPALELQNIPVKQSIEFAEQVLERFQNPFIQHEISALALNGLSKARIRIIPTLTDYSLRFGSAPSLLSVSLAAMLLVYRNTMGHKALAPTTWTNAGKAFSIVDDPDKMKIISDIWAGHQSSDIEGTVGELLASEEIWGANLSVIPELSSQVCNAIHIILTDGIEACIQRILDAHRRANIDDSLVVNEDRY